MSAQNQLIRNQACAGLMPGSSWFKKQGNKKQYSEMTQLAYFIKCNIFWLIPAC